MNSTRELDTALAAIYEPYTGHVAAIEATQKKINRSYKAINPETELARISKQECIIKEARGALAELDKLAEPLEALYRAPVTKRDFLPLT